jgi:hypothetical protein
MEKSTAGGQFTLCGIFLAIGSKSEGLKATMHCSSTLTVHMNSVDDVVS